jgi:RNA polymerase sigma-70 factor (ECF subfamily)
MSSLSQAAVWRASVAAAPSRTKDADPLADAEQLIRRIYAYVAYRIGDGPEAEDVVAATFERAVRYRDRYSRRRGEPIAWLVGIARHCMNDAIAAREPTVELPAELEGSACFEERTIERLELRQAVSRLSRRDQELIALRFGADLSAKSIAQLIDSRTNAVEVALHRALERLRAELSRQRTEAVA